MRRSSCSRSWPDPPPRGRGPRAGGGALSAAQGFGPCPSTILRVVPLPVPGRISRRKRMKRAIITPAVLAGAALGELKAWLAITTPGDDAALTALLRTALETCEAFTGAMPLVQLCEEIVPAAHELAGAGDAAGAGGNLGRGHSRNGRAVRDPGRGLCDRPRRRRRGLVSPASHRRQLGGPRGGALHRRDGGRMGRPAREPAPRRAAAGRASLSPARIGQPQPMPPAAVAALWRPWRRMRVA